MMVLTELMTGFEYESVKLILTPFHYGVDSGWQKLIVNHNVLQRQKTFYNDEVSEVVTDFQ